MPTISAASSSYSFAFAFLSGIFWLDCEDTSAKMENNRMRRFKGQLPLPTTREFEISFDKFNAEEFDVSIDCYFPSDVPIPDPNIFALVTGKFATIDAGHSFAVQIIAFSMVPCVCFLAKYFF
jgi:hypothetical protein